MGPPSLLQHGRTSWPSPPLATDPNHAPLRRGKRTSQVVNAPFPRGRIQFLSIPPSKGLPFPVVFLGKTAKRVRGPQSGEKLVAPLIEREGEPLHRMAEFDIMRLFYVALTRARRSVLLLTVEQQESHFIQELIRDHRLTVQTLNGQTRHTVIYPTCGHGFMTPRPGNYAPFPGLRHHPPLRAQPGLFAFSN